MSSQPAAGRERAAAAAAAWRPARRCRRRRESRGRSRGQDRSQEPGADWADESRFASPIDSVGEAGSTPPGSRPRLTSSRRFSLDYDVETVGPEGLADVELWGTSDGGRTWIKWGSIPTSRARSMSKSTAEAMYGFKVVIVGKSGLASSAPQAGDAADIWVGIDLTRPTARLVVGGLWPGRSRRQARYPLGSHRRQPRQPADHAGDQRPAGRRIHADCSRPAQQRPVLLGIRSPQPAADLPAAGSPRRSRQHRHRSAHRADQGRRACSQRAASAASIRSGAASRMLRRHDGTHPDHLRSDAAVSRSGPLSDQRLQRPDGPGAGGGGDGTGPRSRRRQRPGRGRVSAGGRSAAGSSRPKSCWRPASGSFRSATARSARPPRATIARCSVAEHKTRQDRRAAGARI